MKSRLIFDHIPKTAGTSITNALGRMFGENPALPEFFNMHFQVIRGAGQRRVLAGHLWFTPNEPLAPNWYYATLLRDPIDRFLSQYWFYRALGMQHALDSNQAPHADLQVQAATEMELDQFLDSADSRVRQSFTNVQAVHFARRVTAAPQALSEKSLLEAAIASVEEYDFIGLFEDTQGFVDGIAQDMGLAQVKLPRLNVTRDRPHREDTPQPLLQKLLAANTVDIDLCEWARQRFLEEKRYLHEAKPVVVAGGQSQRLPAEAQAPDPLVPSVPDDTSDAGTELDFGTYEATIRSVTCTGDKSREARIVSGETLRIDVGFVAAAAIEDLTLGIAIRDKRGQLVYGTNTRYLNVAIPVPHEGPFHCAVELRACLGPGQYRVTLALHKGHSHEEGCYHWRENAATFTVVAFGNNEFQGMVDLGLRLAPTANPAEAGVNAVHA